MALAFDILTVCFCAFAALFAGLALRRTIEVSQRGTLSGIRRAIDDQDEAIRGMRREWASASEDLTRSAEDSAKERQRSQAAAARAAKSAKRADAEEPEDDFESYRKRALGSQIPGIGSA